ncbi:PREDICTED: uncharacterized protein LOC108362308 [Rhagoletis zephyria]|uniref:uncharacterized protein LOC108362308 n=1 Tax=Rhagoletis zephyria TaxID=28612 RepID=UPI0008116DFF|nr:PREDICTED: uncharacterized protein LOC108362308 [Rhagoletis zephyria]XP_036340486.1 uncharacterized protein LOC118749820 [Rhagoletis pomonella]
MQDNLDEIEKQKLAWAADGEVAILDLWAERVADLRSARKNGHIYAEMVKELAKLGHSYSARDVQVMLANFTQRYRKEKLGMGPSGGSPSTWPLYGRVHEIIGGFKADIYSELTLESIGEFDTASQPSPLTSTLSSPLPSPLPSLLTTPLPSPSPPLPSPSSPMPNTSASAIEPKRKQDETGVTCNPLQLVEHWNTILCSCGNRLHRMDSA